MPSFDTAHTTSYSAFVKKIFVILSEYHVGLCYRTWLEVHS